MMSRSVDVILVGHGTREQRGLDEFLAFSQAMSTYCKTVCRMQLFDDQIEHAFLEFREPDVTRVILDNYERGARRMILVPLFLLSARHMKTDLPLAVKRAKASAPDLSIVGMGAVNLDTSFADVSLLRLTEAGFAAQQQRKITILFVGRGGHDPDTVNDFERLAQHLQTKVEPHLLVVAFLTGAGPTLEEALARCASTGTHHIFVVPYLLFYGYLMKQLLMRVDRWKAANTHRSVQVTVTAHLGVHDRMVEAICERLRRQLSRI